MPSPFLSIVVPAFNEETRIGASLERILRYLERTGLDAEVIVVDDGSRDRTADIAKKIGARFASFTLLRNTTNRGKGYSVKEGCLAAHGSHILYTDADLSTPIEEVEQLLPWFDRGYDLVVGSRGLDMSFIRVHQPAYRETMGRVFNFLVQLLVLRGIWDTQCGFKCLRSDAAKSILPQQTIARYTSDVEMLAIAHAMGYKIKEVSVRWYHSVPSKVHLVKDSCIMLADLVKIWRRYGRARLP